jgi:hypothetical protein
MKIINRKFHAVLDYLSALLLIVSPWIFNFADIDSAKWSAVGTGVLIFGVSLITDYEGGIKKILSMPGHLVIDSFAGLFLAGAPWIFSFSNQTYLLHLAIGIMSIGASLLTQSGSEHPGTNHVDDFKPVQKAVRRVRASTRIR